tara:strand:+ start:17293 stop:18057 length:765 start_codon:yes stop_codon:yes gene_type:complete
MNKYKKIFNDSKFIILNKFIKNINPIVEKTCFLKKNVVIWENPQDDGGNLFVTNKKRRAFILFLEENNLADVLPVNLKNNKNTFPPFLRKRLDSYKKCYDELYPLLYNPINTILRILGYRRWAIVGITLFSIAPGSPEQEIHHDAPEETKRIFITIPLHKTTLDMGPTVFYDDTKLKDFRQKYMDDENGRSQRPYGNIGYLSDVTEPELFNNARCQFAHDVGDICIHRDITWHSAGNNTSNKHREILFIVIDVM